MELHADEERVVFHFDGFDYVSVGGRAAYHKTTVFKGFAILVVELVSVAVTFFNEIRAVRFLDFRSVSDGRGKSRVS